MGIRRLFRKARRWWADRRALAAADPTTPAGRAIRQAVRREFSPEERQWFADIEALRQQELASSRTVRHVYHGEAGPTRGMSRDELARGVAVDRPLREAADGISVASRKGELLYCLTHELAPERVLELGTGFGVSGLYLLGALVRRDRGHLCSVDASPEGQAIARELWEPRAPGRFTLRLGDLYQALPQILAEVGPPDLAFIDADHSYDGTLRYFEVLAAAMPPGSALLFDDTAFSADMARAWQAIAESPSVASSMTCRGIGIAIRG